MRRRAIHYKGKDIPSTRVEPEVKSVSVKKPQRFFGERTSPRQLRWAPRVLRCRSRRDFLVFGAGALAALAGARFFLPQDTLSRMGIPRNTDSLGKEWFLNKTLRIDDDVAEALYSANRSVPTYTKSQITYPAQEQLQRIYSRSWLYSWMEIDFGWACFWPEPLSRYSESPNPLLGA